MFQSTLKEKNAYRKHESIMTTRDPKLLNKNTGEAEHCKREQKEKEVEETQHKRMTSNTAIDSKSDQGKERSMKNPSNQFLNQRIYI